MHKNMEQTQNNNESTTTYQVLLDRYVKLISTYAVLGPKHKKTCLWAFANNKNTDQIEHPPD